MIINWLTTNLSFKVLNSINKMPAMRLFGKSTRRITWVHLLHMDLWLIRSLRMFLNLLRKSQLRSLKLQSSQWSATTKSLKCKPKWSLLQWPPTIMTSLSPQSRSSSLATPDPRMEQSSRIFLKKLQLTKKRRLPSIKLLDRCKLMMIRWPRSIEWLRMSRTRTNRRSISVKLSKI